jgi:hypothetical protein
MTNLETIRELRTIRGQLPAGEHGDYIATLLVNLENRLAELPAPAKVGLNRRDRYEARRAINDFDVFTGE